MLTGAPKGIALAGTATLIQIDDIDLSATTLYLSSINRRQHIEAHAKRIRGNHFKTTPCTAELDGLLEPKWLLGARTYIGQKAVAINQIDMIDCGTFRPCCGFSKCLCCHMALSITVVANVNALAAQAVSTLCFVLKIGQLLPSFPATNTGIIGFIAHRGLLN